jgi:signal peptidase
VLLVATCLLTILIARVVPLTGRSTLVVAGGSMVPALDIGTAIVAEPVDPASLRVGDIVSLRSGPQQAIFTHRITRLVDRDGAVWIETKGDANAAIDPSITPASAVVGRVSVAVPKLGYLVALLSAPIGILFVISLGSLLLFAGWILEAPGEARRRSADDRVIPDDRPVGATDLDPA